MKKKRMGHLIDYQRDMIEKYKKMIDQNDRTMKIQDNAIIRKDQEIEIANNAAKAIREALEETQEALDRSRNFVRIIQSDKAINQRYGQGSLGTLLWFNRYSRTYRALKAHF